MWSPVINLTLKQQAGALSSGNFGETNGGGWRRALAVPTGDFHRRAMSDSADSLVPKKSPPLAERVDSVVLAILVAIGLYYFLYACAGFWVYTIDDAYITLRQARNLVEGHGFVYNPGGDRVESYTNHLLFLLQAAFLAAGWDGLYWTKIVGVISGVAVLVGAVAFGIVVLRTEAREGGARLPLAGLGFGAVLLGRSPILFTGAVGGLETVLFAALLTWGGVATLWLLRIDAGSKVAVAAGVLLGLATWTRPEGIAWAFGFCTLVGLGRWVLHRRALGPVWIAGGIAVAFWAGLTIWRLAIFGHPFPNTYYAKMALPVLTRLDHGWGYAVDFMIRNGGWLLFAAVIPGVVLLRGAARWMVAIGGAGAACGVLLAWYQGGDWIPHLRMMAPGLGVLAGAALVGVVALAGLLGRGRFTAAVVFPLLFWAAYDRVVEPSLGTAASEIQTRIFGWNDAHKPVGIWLGEWNLNRLEDEEEPLVVAVEDIGLIGWYSRATIIDLAGLADPHWAHLKHSDPSIDYPAEALLNEQRPDIIIIVSQCGGRQDPWRVEWITNRAVYFHPDFAPNYRELVRFTHKDFPGDGYFLHVFARNDVAGEAPPVTPPVPRAVGGR